MTTCAQCGFAVTTPAQACPRCGAPLPAHQPTAPTQTAGSPAAASTTRQGTEPTGWIRARIDTPPEVVTTPTDRQLGARLGTFARPEAYPSYPSWLITGAGRDKLGLLGALLVTWYGLPVGILAGGIGMVVGGIAGYVGGTFGPLVGVKDLPIIGSLISDTPFVGDFVASVAEHSGGILGMLVGIALGALAGFLIGFLGPWILMFTTGGWLGGLAALAAQIPIAALTGLLYTTYAIASENIRFRIAGVRRPSRRERELLGPILHDCGRRLGLENLPTLMVDDDRGVNMYTGARHVVITRGFLDEFTYDPDPIAGVFCHELAHWRNADQISSYLIRGVALPFYIIYNIVWKVVVGLSRRYAFSMLGLVLMIALWPMIVSVRFVLMPLQMLASRRHEYQSDHAAVAAGQRSGIRRTLARLRSSFDGARNGWEQSIGATHPPNELRLELIEELGVDYPLPDPDGPAVPMPIVVTSALDRD